MTARRRAIVVAAACALPASWLLPATVAHASQEPPVERTAWYSAASGGGLAAPQPTTEEDDLRVARVVETSDFSVLLFRGEGVRGSLEVVLREGSVSGTPDLVACPTVGADWEPGGNQPLDAAPEVDCAASTGFGVPAEDGLSMEFGIDSAFEVEPGTWSIALVPTPGGVAPGPPPSAPLPFSVDIVAPEPGSFVLEAELGMEEDPAPAPPADTAPPASEPGTSFGFAPDPGAGFGAVPGGGSAALDAPALDPAVASAPQAAPQTGAAPVALPPALSATPAGVVEDLGAGRRLLALLVLAGGSAAVGYAAGQQRPGPRLLGGRARALGTPALALAADTSPGEDRPRGIGRFAKVREAAPRRLR